MKKQLLARAAYGATLCAAATTLVSCNKRAPGLEDVPVIVEKSAYDQITGSGTSTAAPAAAPAPAPAPAPAVKEAVFANPAPAPAPAAPVPAPAPAPEPATPAPSEAAAPSAPAPAVVLSGPTITIKPEMPKPLFAGTPLPDASPPPNLDKSGKPTLEVAVPEGVTLLSKGKEVTTSDTAPLGEPSLVTDGDKQGDDGYYVDLIPGKQWVQIDLGESKEVHLIWVWHFHKQAVVYKDVVVQISDDPEFATSTTVFNNDFDNSAKFGVGKDQSWVETNNGRPMPVAGVKGRFVRLYSNGRNIDDTNQYIEVEVYGK